jgi:hypothetical protein
VIDEACGVSVPSGRDILKNEGEKGEGGASGIEESKKEGEKGGVGAFGMCETSVPPPLLSFSPPPLPRASDSIFVPPAEGIDGSASLSTNNMRSNS